MTPPSVGPTGSPVVSYTLTGESDDIQHRRSRPSRPAREIYRFDEDLDDWVYLRDRTDEEMSAAMGAYQRALEEHNHTGGLFFEKGPVRMSCKVTCADGCEAEGVSDGKDWRWVALERGG